MNTQQQSALRRLPGLLIICHLARRGQAQPHRWGQISPDTPDPHREDLLPILAYADLAPTNRVIVCRVYPCSIDSWRLMGEAERHWQQAEIVTGNCVCSYG